MALLSPLMLVPHMQSSISWKHSHLKALLEVKPPPDSLMWSLAGFSSSPVFGQRELRCWPEACLSSLPPEPLHGVSHNMATFFIRVSNWESKRGPTRWKLESFCNLNLGVTFHPYAYVLFIRSNSGHIQREGITYRHAY